MDPSSLAMMYAMNVGIEALQGKRGSNLWKDAFKDTALMASLQGFAPKTPTPVKGSLEESLMFQKGPRGITEIDTVRQMSNTVPKIPKVPIQQETDYDKW
ncbi:uncharacterized protein METZ01_LOCUS457114, partial [marine metagenome]